MPSGSEYKSDAIQVSKQTPADQQGAGFGRLVHIEDSPVSIATLVDRIKRNAGLRHGK